MEWYADWLAPFVDKVSGEEEADETFECDGDDSFVVRLLLLLLELLELVVDVFPLLLLDFPLKLGNTFDCVDDTVFLYERSFDACNWWCCCCWRWLEWWWWIMSLLANRWLGVVWYCWLLNWCWLWWSEWACGWWLRCWWWLNWLWLYWFNGWLKWADEMPNCSSNFDSLDTNMNYHLIIDMLKKSQLMTTTRMQTSCVAVVVAVGVDDVDDLAKWAYQPHLYCWLMSNLLNRLLNDDCLMMTCWVLT